MGSFQGESHSLTASKKKAVTLKLTEPDGSITIETASPKGDVVNARKLILKSNSDHSEVPMN